MKNLLAVIISIILLNAGFSQSLSRGYSKEQLTSYLEDVRLKHQIIPDNDIQVYEELKWVSSELSKFSNYSRTDIEDIEEKLQNTRELEDRAKNLFEKIGILDCSLESRNEAYSKFYSIMTTVDNFSFRYDTDESSEYVNLMAEVRPIINGAEDQNGFTTKDCETFKSKLETTVKNAVIATIVKIQKTIQEELDDINDKESVYQNIEKELTGYRDKLIEKQKKLNTKQNLGSNLYIMILIIGLLSVLAIGLVRLFPEKVMLEWVVSGQVIQFVTIMILLSAIMALGLSGLVTENTLGTLLGGIAGYVLSQGIGISRQNANRNTPNNNN
ncbi:MAG: hypothetical protein RLO81_14695 [Fulvivirga sp.]|uniref:hypothetical protein n=1 Tax=Fulvivirga sp. TaxID=1931237 RepID=UPI0032EEBAAC